MQYFYWYLYVLLWIIAFLGQNLSQKIQQRILAIYCGLWAFVFGFRRYDVGNDTPDYAAFFENTGAGLKYGTIDKPFDTIEEGFLLMSKLINYFTDDATIVFLLLGILLWIGIYYLYKSQSRTPLLALLFMLTITGRMFYTLEIAVRQACSIIVILLGLLCFLKSGVKNWKELLRNKNAVVGFLLCLISITIHRTSGFLAIVLALLYLVKLNKVVSYVLIFGFAIFAMSGAAIFAQFFDTAMVFIGGLSDENVNLLGDRYMGDVNEKGGWSGGIMLAWALPSFLTVYLSKKEQVNTFFFKTFIFTYCLHQLMQYSTMHERLTTLFLLIGFTVSIPEICWKKKSLYNLYLLIGIYYLYYSYRMFSNWPLKDDAAVPYYFIWQ